ncbi:MAG TPA: PQQ-dependent sugar dehydrogenase [Tepidisphaeraceae bacterium]|nr:PQQ-dependent sugar dehydrogenase [Tepidisphaeraceae bacterium]
MRCHPCVEALEARRLLADPGFVWDTLLTGDTSLPGPTSMAFAPDGRLFVTTQEGSIRVARNVASGPGGGPITHTEFARVQTVRPGTEAGLLGLALDPDFATNGYVYVYYTYRPANLNEPAYNRVTRFTASADNPDVAEPGSETVLLNIDPLAGSVHLGGAVHFGPDGKLYVAVGDHGGLDDDTQRLTSLHGKILRINKDGSIPPDNPFYEVAEGDGRAVWALGLRNPFTFAFQPGTGRMFINDVGESAWEEINEGIAGANYGWVLTRDGPFHPDDLPILRTRPEQQNFVAPLYAYAHDGGSVVTGTVIAGGAFYNPPPSAQQFPAEYVGDYFFGDNGGRGGVLDPAADPGIDLRRRNPLRVNVDYDGATLRVAMRDLVTGGTASQSYTVDIPANAGETAYVGFTAGAGTGENWQSVLNWTFTPAGSDVPAIDFGRGFDSTGGLDFNGTASTGPLRTLRVAAGPTSTGSVFHTTPVSTAAFSTQFDLKQSNTPTFSSKFEGMTFTIQGNGPDALGLRADGLGYSGIGRSVAVIFDAQDGRTRQGINQTGVYASGAAVAIIDLTPTDRRVRRLDYPAAVVDLDVGPDGALYFLAYDTYQWPHGKIGRLRYTDGPRVTGVAVDSTSWSDGFRAALPGSGSGSVQPGYSLPTGPAQDDVLPWPGLDRFHLQFDKAIDEASLQRPGVVSLLRAGAPTVELEFVSYDPATRTGTWALPEGELLGAGRWTVVVADTVTDVQSRPLDGEWANGADVFPSGNGAPGGAFAFRVNVLPGDANNDGRVSPVDFAQVRARLLLSVRMPSIRGRSYSIFHDLNGDGRISLADLVLLRRHLFDTLPPIVAVGASLQDRSRTGADNQQLNGSAIIPAFETSVVVPVQ